MRNKVLFYVLVYVSFLMSCNLKPSEKEVVEQEFTFDQIRVIKTGMLERHDTLSYYNISDSRSLINTNWTIIDPIFINNSYTRAVALIPNWIRKNDKIYNSLIWICGYRYYGDWYFFSPTETQILARHDSPSEDYDPLKWRPVSSAIQDYTKSYLKYNYLKFKWEINDDWFRGFMDNRDYLRSDHYHYSDQKILELPDSYWIERHMPYEVMEIRGLDKLKELRKEENAKYRRGEYSEEEWEAIQKIRNPKSSEDWKRVRAYNKKIAEDPYIQSALTWKYGDPVE